MAEIKEVTIVLRDGWERNVTKEKVLWECPTCGEPMGEPKGHNTYEDGDTFWCNVWDNPCGHVAKYKELKLQMEDGTFITWSAILTAKKTNVKDWYVAAFPTDDMGPELDDHLSFYGVYQSLGTFQGVYDELGVGDSIVRERVFDKLAQIMNVEYDSIYKQWLRG